VARRVVVTVGADGTEKNQISLLTCNLQVETSDGSLEPVVLEGGFVTAGKTADAEAAQINPTVSQRGRAALAAWRKEHHGQFPGEDFGVDPDDFGLHRGGGGASIQGDTCNQANLLKEKLQEEIKTACAAHDPDWHLYDEDEKAHKVRTHQADCWIHLRNIWFGAASKAIAVEVKEGLAADLDNFSYYERITTDIMQLIRAVYKEFHGGGGYAKGKGRKDYHVWLEANYPEAFYINESRAAGGRQDLEYEACVAVYVNRPYYVEFLAMLMTDIAHSNILEDYLFVVLISVEMLAAVRTYAIFYVTFITELRFLTGSGHLLTDWSPASMAKVADKLEEWMLEGASEPQAIVDLLDSSDSPFSSIEREQPLFAGYRKREAEATASSPNGKVQHARDSKVRAALARPFDDASNRATTRRMLELVQIGCARIVEDLRDVRKRTHRYLGSQDGLLAWGAEATQLAHKDTVGCYTTNDVLCESVFGAFTEYLPRHGTIGVEAVSGVVTARRNGDFERAGTFTLKRKRQRPSAAPAQTAASRAKAAPREGAFQGLSRSMMISLIEYAHKDYEKARKLDAEVLEQHNAYWVEKREASRAEGLRKLKGEYLATLEFWEQREGRRVTMREVNSDLQRCSGDGKRIVYLKLAIEIRVVGFGWSDLALAWSKDGVQKGTKALKAALVGILEVERARGVPEDPPVPSMHRKTLKQLGAPIGQFDELRAAGDVAQADFETAVAAERMHRGAAGRKQAAAPPRVDESLVDARIEYAEKVTFADKTSTIYWISGVVLEVSDGETPRTPRSLTAMPLSYARVEFEPQSVLGENENEVTEKWVALTARKFNGEAKGCWRLYL